MSRLDPRNIGRSPKSSGSVLAVDGDGDPLTYSLLTEPDPGTVVLAPNGAFVYSPYDPTPRFDRFAFEATDEVSVSDEGTQHLWEAIPIPEPGYNWGGAFTGVHDRVLPLGEMVAVSQVYDPNNPPPPWYPVVVTPPEHGTLDADLADFTPDAGYIGTDTFTFYLTNNIVSTNVARVYLTITNVAPVTRADAYVTPENVPVSGDVTENDDDLDYDPVTAQLVEGPSASEGTLTLHGDGTFDFVPTEHYHGITSFTYRLTDGVESSLPSTAYITVQASQPPEIYITNRDGNEFDSNGMKVAKWINDGFEAFEINGANAVKIKGPDANNYDFIDRDLDRFNVWVFDDAAWDKMSNGVPTYPHIQVKISTINIEGFKVYDDPATSVDLVRYTGGGAKINPDGWFWSDSQMLVSNKIDDEVPAAGTSATGDTSAAAYLGTDESAPGADQLNTKNGGYTWKVSDRTHMIALGGKVKAEYTSPNEKKAKPAEESVKVRATVKVNVTILRDKKQSAGGVPVIEKSEAAKVVLRANEQFAQVGMRVRIVGNGPQIIDPPGNGLVNLADGLTIASTLTPEQIALLGAENPNPRTADVKDVELYFVNYMSGHPAGVAVVSKYLSAPEQKYADSVIISQDDRKPFTIPHEIAHLLMNRDWHYGLPLWPANLMRLGTSKVDKVEESKRLNQNEEDAMYANRPTLLSPPG